MKLLFDENLSFRLCTLLSSLFPGSTQVRLVGLERASDLEVWHYAGFGMGRLRRTSTVA